MFLLTSSQRKALHTHTQIQSSTPDNCKGNWFVTIAILNVQLPCCQPASDQHQQPKYTSSSADCAACLGPSCQKSNVSVYKAPILTKCFMRYNYSVVKANKLYFKYFAFFCEYNQLLWNQHRSSDQPEKKSNLLQQKS